MFVLALNLMQNALVLFGNQLIFHLNQVHGLLLIFDFILVTLNLVILLFNKLNLFAFVLKSNLN